MSTALQKQGQQSPKAKTDAFMHEVVTRKTTFQRLLPKGMDPDWFLAEVRVAVARAPGLLDCDRVSVIDALTTCAQLGLSPSGRLGSAWLIPFKTRCTLVIGYRGLIDLAYRSGEVVSIGAQVVYENEPFDVVEGFDITINKHDRDVDDPGALRAVYAWAEMRGGYKVRVLMWRREVLAIKARAPGAAKTDSPWHTHEPEQWKKTALRRLGKLIPLSPQKAQGLQRALEAEDAEFEDIPADVEPEAQPASAVEGLKKTLAARNKAERIDDVVSENPQPLSISHPDAQPPEPGAEG